MPDSAKDIDKAKQKAIDELNKRIDEMGRAAYTIMLQSIEDTFDFKSGKIQGGKNFIKQLNKLTVDVLNLIQSEPKFTGPVSQFVKRMQPISDAITDFQKSTNGIKVPDFEIAKKIVLDEIVDKMLNNGLNQHFVQPLRDLIYQNVTGGLSLSDARTQIKEYIDGKPISQPVKAPDVIGEKVPYKPNLNLPDKYASIETKFGKELNDNFEKNKAEYIRVNKNVINTDNARDLSVDYRNNRGELASAVHEPSSAFVKKVYEDLLKKTPVSKTVAFTAGGTGSGKTTAIESVPSVRLIANAADIVYDSNMNTTSSAVSKINQALASGRSVHILFSYRDVVESFEQGVIPRMQRIGRSVPIEEHIKTHTGSVTTSAELQEIYKDNPNVKFKFIDNSLGKGNAKEVSFAEVKKKSYFDVKEIKEKLYESADKKLQRGEITAEQHKGLTVKGTNTEGAGKTVSGGGVGLLRPGDGAGAQRSTQPRQEPIGKLARYLEQTAVQAVDAYSGAINTKLLETFDYDGLLITGSLIDNSSKQCRFAIEELGGKITRENWPKVEAIGKKQSGWIEGTTFDNLPMNKLHWGCRHGFYPIILKKTA